MRKKKSQIQSRKQQRKESRLAKKARKHEFFSKKKTHVQRIKNDDNESFLKRNQEKSVRFTDNSSNKKKLAKLTNVLSLQDEKLKELQILKQQTKSLEKQMKKKRVKLLEEDAAADDLEIKRLEKHLGLNKRKEKSKAFSSDGLDYLLDVCDHTKLKDTIEAEKLFKEDDTDFGDDVARVMGKVIDSNKKGIIATKRKITSTVSEPSAERCENESSDSEPEEMLSTKGGLKFPHFKKKVHDQSKNLEMRESTASDFYEDDTMGFNENESDASQSDSGNDFGLNDLNNDSAENDDDESDLSETPADSKANLQGKKKRKESDSFEDNSLMKKKVKVTDEKPQKGSNKKDKKCLKDTLKSSKHDSSKIKGIVSNKKLDNPSDNDLSELDDSDDGKSEGEDEKLEKIEEDGTWEDIYGRTRDKEGNVVIKYQPPQRRTPLEEGSTNQEKLLRLKKQMKGLLNRLAENNMVSICSQIEALYRNHSRNEMNETLWSLFRDALLGETDSPERLVAEHAMALAVLSANVGGEVSAHCIQRCVTEWHNLWNAGPQVPDKRTNNILILLCYMYHFKLFHGTLLYDILYKLLEKPDEKEVELVLLILRTVGFSLRKEDPIRLKDFVIKAQTMANNTTSSSDGSRIKFLLDTVLAIKNNNMSKIPNYNPEDADRLKKTLRASVRKGNYNAELKISLDDLLKAEERGRWWVVGSAWTGELPGEKEGVDETPRPSKKMGGGFSSKLLELAKKQRMNTDTRRTVFCVIMSAEDYVDAFEKLLKLGLKGPSEREIMNVLLHCLLQEKEFNPYYEHLARRLCVCNRRFQVMLQFATWDRIQDLKALSSTQVTNFAKFLGHLILGKNLAISVLKVVEFGELDKAAVRFIRLVLLAILLAEAEDAMVAAFGRIAGSKDLKLFREGLRLFLHHFVLRNSKDVEGTDMAFLTTRVKLADCALSAADRNLTF